MLHSHTTQAQSGACDESSVTYSACWRARLCRHTCLTLTSRKPVAGSTLLSLISIIREDVRGEPALISLSKAPCQLGNLCTGLWCTTQRISCDWAFALPTVSSDFSVAKNHMLLRQCCLITWECSETSPLLKAASLKGGATGVLQINVCTPPIAHTQVSSSTVPLCNLFLRSYSVCHVFGLLDFSLWHYKYSGGKEHGANNAFANLLFLPHLKILSRWKGFICKKESIRLTEEKW